MHMVDCNEFIFTCDYIFGFHIVCLISGMCFYRCVLVFDVTRSFTYTL